MARAIATVYGTVFSLTPPAVPSGSWTEAFYSISRDIGAHPSGVTIGGDGVLYCATQFAAFAIKPPTTSIAPWVAKVISSGSPIITYPNGAMTVGAGGVPYGTSYDGASTYDGYGDVFSLTQMIEMLLLTRQRGHGRLRQAVETALATGCTDPAAVRHLLHAGELNHAVCEVIDVGLLARYERPAPVMNEYDRLLMAGGAQ